MTQSLFGCIGRPALPEPLRLGTPVGTLLTAFCSSETGANESLPQSDFSLSNGARLSRFDASMAEIEVVTGLINPDIPSHMRIGGCRAALWRVRAHGSLHLVRFSCWWPDAPTLADGAPDTGEGLDAYTWWMGDSVLSVGTEDGEFLAHRASANNHVPSRLGPELSLSTVQYSQSRMDVPFSTLERGELLQVQFVAAWEESSSPESASTWFAVEQRPALVYEQLVGSGTNAG